MPVIAQFNHSSYHGEGLCGHLSSSEMLCQGFLWLPEVMKSHVITVAYPHTDVFHVLCSGWGNYGKLQAVLKNSRHFYFLFSCGRKNTYMKNPLLFPHCSHIPYILVCLRMSFVQYPCFYRHLFPWADQGPHLFYFTHFQHQVQCQRFKIIQIYECLIC